MRARVRARVRERGRGQRRNLRHSGKTSKLRTSEPVIDSGIARLVKQPYRTKIQTILDDISLNDAHELYRELHTYFGGLSK